MRRRRPSSSSSGAAASLSPPPPSLLSKFSSPPLHSSSSSSSSSSSASSSSMDFPLSRTYQSRPRSGNDHPRLRIKSTMQRILKRRQQERRASKSNPLLQHYSQQQPQQRTSCVNRAAPPSSNNQTPSYLKVTTSPVVTWRTGRKPQHTTRPRPPSPSASSSSVMKMWGAPADTFHTRHNQPRLPVSQASASVQSRSSDVHLNLRHHLHSRAAPAPPPPPPQKMQGEQRMFARQQTAAASLWGGSRHGQSPLFASPNLSSTAAASLKSMHQALRPQRVRGQGAQQVSTGTPGQQSGLAGFASEHHIDALRQEVHRSDGDAAIDTQAESEDKEQEDGAKAAYVEPEHKRGLSPTGGRQVVHVREAESGCGNLPAPGTRAHGLLLAAPPELRQLVSTMSAATQGGKGGKGDARGSALKSQRPRQWPRQMGVDMDMDIGMSMDQQRENEHKFEEKRSSETVDGVSSVSAIPPGDARQVGDGRKTGTAPAPSITKDSQSFTLNLLQRTLPGGQAGPRFPPIACDGIASASDPQAEGLDQSSDGEVWSPRDAGTSTAGVGPSPSKQAIAEGRVISPATFSTTSHDAQESEQNYRSLLENTEASQSYGDFCAMLGVQGPLDNPNRPNGLVFNDTTAQQFMQPLMDFHMRRRVLSRAGTEGEEKADEAASSSHPDELRGEAAGGFSDLDSDLEDIPMNDANTVVVGNRVFAAMDMGIEIAASSSEGGRVSVVDSEAHTRRTLVQTSLSVDNWVDLEDFASDDSCEEGEEPCHASHNADVAEAGKNPESGAASSGEGGDEGDEGRGFIEANDNVDKVCPDILPRGIPMDLVGSPQRDRIDSNDFVVVAETVCTHGEKHAAPHSPRAATKPARVLSVNVAVDHDQMAVPSPQTSPDSWEDAAASLLPTAGDGLQENVSGEQEGEAEEDAGLKAGVASKKYDGGNSPDTPKSDGSSWDVVVSPSKNVGLVNVEAEKQVGSAAGGPEQQVAKAAAMQGQQTEQPTLVTNAVQPFELDETFDYDSCECVPRFSAYAGS